MKNLYSNVFCIKILHILKKFQIIRLTIKKIL